MQAIPTALRQPTSLVFSHMGFYVRDLERMARFYKDVMCFTETDRGDLGVVQLVFLSRDPSEHHQVVLATGRPTDVSFSVINQMSFRVPDLATLKVVRHPWQCCVHLFSGPRGQPAGSVHGHALVLRAALARADRPESARRCHPGACRSHCP